MTRYHWLVLFVAWLGWVFDIMDTALFNFAKGPMFEEFARTDPTLKENLPVIEGQMLTILLVGWSIGGLVFGILADRWGRTRTMVVTILIYCIFTGLTALCQNWQQVAAIRFITALGIGGEWAAGAALIAEVLPNRARAAGAAILQTAAAFGPVFAALANLAIPPADWRKLFLIGIAPAFITIFIRIWVKEPERWAENDARKSGSFFKPLLEMFAHPTWRKHAMVALVIGLVGIAAAGTIAFWLPNMVKAVSEGLSKEDLSKRVSHATMIMHIGTFLGVFAVPWLCEKIGRKRALFAFFLASPLSILAVTYGGGSYDRLLLLSPLMSFFTIGLSAAFVLYFPELFPTSLRATGAGFAYNTGRILAAGVPLVTASLIQSGAGTASPVMDAVGRTAIFLSLGIVALFFAPETRGKGLPEETGKA